MKNIDLSLYLVTDDIGNRERFLKVIEESILGGVTIVQLREKNMDTLDFYNLGLDVKEITSRHNIPLIINDRVDIALAVDADGVHVGQSDMPCSVTRALIGDDRILGVSATSIEEAEKAERDGADYIGSGAIFPTNTKDDASLITKNDLENIVNSVNIPVVAIGGITTENASELNGIGIEGLSVVSAIMKSDNPKNTSEKLLNIFNS